MNEGLSNYDRLEAVEVHGQSLVQWHKWLTTDEETGKPTGHLACPASRYGRIAADCAWWAIAGEIIYVEANGEEGDPHTSLDYLMGLAVNDHDDIGTLVCDYWYVLPLPLK